MYRAFHIPYGGSSAAGAARAAAASAAEATPTQRGYDADTTLVTSLAFLSMIQHLAPHICDDPTHTLPCFTTLWHALIL